MDDGEEVVRGLPQAESGAGLLAPALEAQPVRPAVLQEQGCCGQGRRRPPRQAVIKQGQPDRRDQRQLSLQSPKQHGVQLSHGQRGQQSCQAPHVLRGPEGLPALRLLLGVATQQLDQGIPRAVSGLSFRGCWVGRWAARRASGRLSRARVTSRSGASSM